MDKVVVGIHILEKLAVLVTAHTARRTGRIERPRGFIGSDIKIMVVLTLVDPYAPENDRGVVTVLAHHLPDRLHADVLPFIIPQVLPSRRLGKDGHSQLVTSSDKMVRLRIMGGTHGITAELVFEDIRVEPLHGARHRVADIGPALVSVQSAQLEFSAVEIEAVLLEFGTAEADPAAQGIDHLSALDQLDLQLIKHGTERIPQTSARDSDRIITADRYRDITEHGIIIPLGHGHTHFVRVADNIDIAVDHAVKAQSGDQTRLCL